MPKQRYQTTVLDSNLENVSIGHQDNIRKSYSSTNHEEIIPVPIQIFLWRQSNPFIKQKFGNLTDASAISFDRILAQNMLHGLSPSLSDALASIPRWLLIKTAFPHVMHACSSTILHSIQQQSSSNIHPSSLLSSPPSRSPSASTQLQLPSSSQLPASLNPISSATLSPSVSVERHSLLYRFSLSTNNYSLNPTEIHLFHTLHYLILDGNENKISINNDEVISLNIIQLFIYLFIPYVHTYIHNN